MKITRTITLISALFLSQIIAQGGYDELGHIGPRIELYNPNPFSGATRLDVALQPEEWTDQKEPIPYTYPWENTIGQTAQQMVAIISLLESEGLTYLDITLFLLEMENMQSSMKKSN